MKYFFLFILLMALTVNFYGQNNDVVFSDPKIIPQSPETASLLKYSETPVSYHTGVPNITIPLTEISSRELGMSVNITYHAGGHRVTEESTWLGLGWNLSAGGQITRTVRGRVDDHYPSGFIYTQATVDYIKDFICTQGNSFQGMSCYNFTNGESTIDMEPDDFNYSMMGLSGRFMFDQNRTTLNDNKGNIVQFPDKKVIITPIYAPDVVVVSSGVVDLRRRIIGWDITDTQGTVYHFEEGNVFINANNLPFKKAGTAPEIPVSGTSTNVDYIETWNLTKVTSLSGDEITFEYHTPVVPNRNYNEFTCTITDEQVGVNMQYDNLVYNPHESIVTYTSVSRTRRELSKIVFPNGFIRLIKSPVQREDTHPESPKNALKGLKVYSTFLSGATQDSILVKDIEFVQSYFVSTPSDKSEFIATGPVYLNPNQSSFLNKRLRLDEVKFKSIDINSTIDDSYSYTFDYNSVALPHKRSNAQDHWGFYNGATSNFTLIPDFIINVQTYGSGNSFTFSPAQGSANRDVNSHYSKAFSLSSITYPEGGKTMYTFENNKKDVNGTTTYFGGLRIHKIKNLNSYSTFQETVFEYEGGHILSSPIYYSVSANNVHTMHSQSWQPLLTTQSSYVNYTKVKETQYDNKTQVLIDDGFSLTDVKIDSSIVKRTYSPATGNLNDWSAPYVNEWSSGQLSSVQFGNDTNIKKKQTFSRSVYENTSSPIVGYAAVAKWEITDPDLPFNLANFNPYGCGDRCHIETYTIKPGRKILTHERTEVFEQGLSLVTEKDISHNAIPYHFNPTEVVSTHNDGRTTETRFKYPYEMSHTNLKNENRINTLLLTESIQDSTLLSAVKTEYSSFHNIQQKQAVKSGKYNTLLPDRDRGSQLPVATSGFEDRLIYHDYYPNGNLQEVSKKDGTHIVYIWGYNKSLPVAKIENATYTEVALYISNIEYLSNLDNDRTLGTSGNEGMLRTALNNLRNVSSLSDALITTYTYDPLVGVTSITDPRGNTVYYDYDGFNRLITVKDYQGNILSANQYNYKN